MKFNTVEERKEAANLVYDSYRNMENGEERVRLWNIEREILCSEIGKEEDE